MADKIQRRHYLIIADILAAIPCEVTREAMISLFAHYLEGTNERYDRDVFARAVYASEEGEKRREDGDNPLLGFLGTVDSQAAAEMRALAPVATAETPAPLTPRQLRAAKARAEGATPAASGTPLTRPTPKFLAAMTELWGEEHARNLAAKAGVPYITTAATPELMRAPIPLLDGSAEPAAPRQSSDLPPAAASNPPPSGSGPPKAQPPQFINPRLLAMITVNRGEPFARELARLSGVPYITSVAPELMDTPVLMLPDTAPPVDPDGCDDLI